MNQFCCRSVQCKHNSGLHVLIYLSPLRFPGTLAICFKEFPFNVLHPPERIFQHIVNTGTGNVLTWAVVDNNKKRSFMKGTRVHLSKSINCFLGHDQ